MPVAVLASVSIPAAAFWIEWLVEGQIWYITNRGGARDVLEVLAPSWFWLAPILIVQLVIVVQSWSGLKPSSRVLAIALTCLPVAAIVVVPLLLSMGL